MDAILQNPYVEAYVVPLVGFLVTVIVAWIVAGFIRRMIRTRLARPEIDVTVVRFASNLAYYGILIVAIVSALQKFGIGTASFAAVLAAAGLAIGLAFQGSLSNFAAGIMLVIFRPFQVGDVIDVAGTRGKVFEIQLFTTFIDTPDNRRIIVPNKDIFGSEIENVTFHPTRRVDVSVGTDYPADLAETRAVLMQAAENVEGRLTDKDAVVYLDSLGDSSINWAVRVWATREDFWDVKERLTEDVKNALDDAGIGIPYPQMDVHMDKVG